MSDLTKEEIAQFEKGDAYLKNLINTEFTLSEQQAILVQMADAVGDGRMYETYREQRNDRDVLMVRVYPKSMVKTNENPN